MDLELHLILRGIAPVHYVWQLAFQPASNYVQVSDAAYTFTSLFHVDILYYLITGSRVKFKY